MEKSFVITVVAILALSIVASYLQPSTTGLLVSSKTIDKGYNYRTSYQKLSPGSPARDTPKCPSSPPCGAGNCAISLGKNTYPGKCTQFGGGQASFCGCVIDKEAWQKLLPK